jgi:hypothetical protein
MDQTGQRELARLDRIHAAQGLVPLPLWIALFTIFVVILVYINSAMALLSGPVLRMGAGGVLVVGGTQKSR